MSHPLHGHFTLFSLLKLPKLLLLIPKVLPSFYCVHYYQRIRAEPGGYSSETIAFPILLIYLPVRILLADPESVVLHKAVRTYQHKFCVRIPEITAVCFLATDRTDHLSSLLALTSAISITPVHTPMMNMQMILIMLISIILCIPCYQKNGKSSAVISESNSST